MKSLFCTILLLFSSQVSFSHCLESQQDVFVHSELGFLERWQDFQKDVKFFPLWKPHWTQEELKVRYDQMYQMRWALYFTNTEDYKQIDALGIPKEQYQSPKDWKKWGSRYPFPGAFSYNVATPSYNASVLSIHGKKFIALEAPTQQNLSRFYDVLTQYQVTDLVRLTSATSGKKENSFPYWEGHMNISKKNGRSTIELSGREINYFFTDCWANHEGGDPERVIALVKALMENEGQDQMIAVHCRAGVGRTGAFLAAYTIIRDIDEQLMRGVCLNDIQISIDKIVWELSLQRPLMVTHFSQYVMLYELVAIYTNKKRT